MVDNGKPGKSVSSWAPSFGPFTRASKQRHPRTGVGMKMTLGFGLAGHWAGWISPRVRRRGGVSELRLEPMSMSGAPLFQTLFRIETTMLEHQTPNSLVRQSPNATLTNEPDIRPSIEQKTVFIIFPTRALMPHASSFKYSRALTHERTTRRAQSTPPSRPTTTCLLFDPLP